MTEQRGLPTAPRLRLMLRADLARIDLGGWVAMLWAFATRPGARAVIIYRIQAKCEGLGFKRVAQLLCTANGVLNGCELMVGCSFGPGLVLRHPVGVVVGHKVAVGSNCDLQQGITLGERYGDGSGDHLYPSLGDNVSVGAKASVLGGVEIGSNVAIGAHALVLNDVPPNSVAVGVPARIVARAAPRHQP